MKGILFKIDNIKATVEDRKTVTRRLIRLPKFPDPEPKPDEWNIREGVNIFIACNTKVNYQEYVKPRYLPGEIVFIKEAWAICSFSANFAKESQLQVAYRLGFSDIDHPDGNTHDLEWRTVDYAAWQKYATQKYYSWQSPMFMPEWAARHFIKIKNVRPERLQAITEEDALKEGITIMAGTHRAIELDPVTGRLKIVGEPEPFTARYHYEALWDSINKEYMWASNPWVWRYEYERVRKAEGGNYVSICGS